MNLDGTSDHVYQRLSEAGCDVIVRHEGEGVSIYFANEQPFARLRCLGEAGWEVRRPMAKSWTYIGEFGGAAFEQLDDAIQYIIDDPMDVLSGDGE